MTDSGHGYLSCSVMKAFYIAVLRVDDEADCGDLFRSTIALPILKVVFDIIAKV
jgi:hypothetical protein